MKSKHKNWKSESDTKISIQWWREERERELTETSRLRLLVLRSLCCYCCYCCQWCWQYPEQWSHADHFPDNSIRQDKCVCVIIWSVIYWQTKRHHQWQKEKRKIHFTLVSKFSKSGRSLFHITQLLKHTVSLTHSHTNQRLNYQLVMVVFVKADTIIVNIQLVEGRR